MTTFFAGSVNMREMMCMQLCMCMAVPSPESLRWRLLRRA